MSLVENFLLGEASGSAVGEDPENMSEDSLESGENVIEFLFWGCRLCFKKSVRKKIPGLYEVPKLRNLNFCCCTVCFLGGWIGDKKTILILILIWIGMISYNWHLVLHKKGQCLIV